MTCGGDVGDGKVVRALHRQVHNTSLERVMHVQEFLGQVQHLGHMSTMDEALRATRCTLETLAERLGGNEPEKLGAELPNELKPYLQLHGDVARFDAHTFLARVSEKEGVGLPITVFHVRAVLDVLGQAISPGALEKMKHQLPGDYQRLFKGSQGKMCRS